MITILTVKEIDKNKVTLLAETGSEHTFHNLSGCTKILMKFLSDHDCVEIYEDVIAPLWKSTKSMNQSDVARVRREDKRSYIKQRCHELIVHGIDCDVGLVDGEGHNRGTLHYSLTERHQNDMRDLMNMIKSGQPQVTWRDDARVSHEIYSADQFRYLYTTACEFILSCRFRSDALELLLDSYGDDVSKINSLTWETEIPEEINDQIAKLLSVMSSTN